MPSTLLASQYLQFGHRFSPLKVSGISGPYLAVAVPSRLYFPKTPSKQLNRMRIVIKDNFDVKGIHTAVFNKSVSRLRTGAKTTAPVVSELLAKLEELLGVTETLIDVGKEWTADNPMGTGQVTYKQIHGPASYDYQSEWAKEYGEMFGKAPYLAPAIKNGWTDVKPINPEEVAGAWKQVDAYKKWFQTKYLSADPDTSSIAMMVGRWIWKLNYRDTLNETPNAGRDYGFGQEFSPSFAEPELLIYIWQYEYHSKISQYTPVAVSITGAKGSDRVLLKLAEELLAFACIPATVLTGKTPFPAQEHRLPGDWKL
ncbi:hypothetical protein B0T14DRAFT_563947 [Immersiella caudata]|uniref:Uncharacterized protein n=1 Tax=Immersiella caudata TaxID=314043 RepID=A0AA39WW54_9PEZI|nr:hypothetical protein B0T14DRAFT_563947 [Immersiella caudata]